MNEIMNLILFLIAGAGMGFFYFGGLWWTVNRLAHSRKPHLLVFTSFFIRSGVCLAGLFWVARDGQWKNIIASILGLLAVRWILIRQWKPKKEQKSTLLEG